MTGDETLANTSEFHPSALFGPASLSSRLVGIVVCLCVGGIRRIKDVGTHTQYTLRHTRTLAHAGPVSRGKQMAETRSPT